MVTALFISKAAAASATDSIAIVGLTVQAIAVIVAVVASVVALVIASQDRKALLGIAQRDREHERLRTELEYAVRLATNRNMGGSTDSATSHRLGAEALALATVVGARWVPRQFKRATEDKAPEELLGMLQNSESETPRWVKDKIETAIALQQIMDEMYRLTASSAPDAVGKAGEDPDRDAPA